MPYITQKERDELDPLINKLWELCGQFRVRGRINYCCTRLIHLWCIEQMRKIKSLTKKYDIVNDAHGILNCIADEFYNAVVVPYEKLKREENGSVSQLDARANGKAEDLYRCKCGKIFKASEFVERSDYCLCPHCSSEDYELINNESAV